MLNQRPATYEKSEWIRALLYWGCLLPADWIVVFLAQTAIDESFVHRTRPLLARQAVNYAARNTGSSAAGSAHRGARPSAT